ncbi:hypothetical protein G7Z17_g10166 [Cylindrodendrum hubeiense]|uniref:Uncharacterized protein n=1 Tax=Cylindrodendrum hubeiense TaxID=595255 RepID=A0A9P5H2M5_9HYPO|nr:hypothetical protein G7Z17_g10166 [Cylindrodendrum hubeiense]
MNSGGVRKNKPVRAAKKSKLESKWDAEHLKLFKMSGQVAATGNPSVFELFGSGSSPGEHYFVVPVSEALRHHTRERLRYPLGQPGLGGLVHLRGVSIQMDISHQGPMEAFAVCVPVPPGVNMPKVGMLDGSGFPNATGANPVMEKGGDHLVFRWGHIDYDGAVGASCSTAFTKYVDSHAAFDAPLNQGVLPKGDARTGNSKMVHSGRANWDLHQQPVDGAGVPTAYVNETCRSFWNLNKQVSISDVKGERYVIICGIRYKAEMTSAIWGTTQSTMMGWMENLQVTYYTGEKT